VPFGTDHGLPVLQSLLLEELIISDTINPMQMEVNKEIQDARNKPVHCVAMKKQY
jgi:hypothetical protein